MRILSRKLHKTIKKFDLIPKFFHGKFQYFLRFTGIKLKICRNQIQYILCYNRNFIA